MAVEYGIREIKFMSANIDGGFPDFNGLAGVRLMNLVVVDSFQEDKDSDKETKLYVEESDEAVSTVVERGMRTITFRTYDLSAEQYMYLMGYVYRDGYLVENPGFVLPPQAMRLITKPLGDYPAKIREWARLNVKVKKIGGTGKNGLPVLQLDIEVQGNGGIPVYRERVIEIDASLSKIIAGGWADALAPVDEYGVKSLATRLPVSEASPFVRYNPAKGNVFEFTTPEGTMTVCIVMPAMLGSPQRILSKNPSYEITALFALAGEQVSIDEVLCNVYFCTGLVPFAGQMKIEVMI